MLFYRLFLQDFVEALLKIHSNFIAWKKWLNIQHSLRWLNMYLWPWDAPPTSQKQVQWPLSQQIFVE
jgi:hypothetical protein